ncbi:unnamed protein product [Periconia digitata]|uniref:F-box domain-containing protein n=1 Tax=Periconia digitata TaxID=1303443 RepID=A0A9W4UWZ6_9PLEO|nr:unnamed protein product [Periconia digitata]
MGYSEVLCQICGVSFNIGRIRRPDEPRSAAWALYGPIARKSLWDYTSRENMLSSFVEQRTDFRRASCGQDSGCMFVTRNPRTKNIDWPGFRNNVEHSTGEVDGDSSDDSEWVPTDEEEQESLEYSSENEDNSDGGNVDQEGDVTMANSDLDAGDMFPSTLSLVQDQMIFNPCTWNGEQLERLVGGSEQLPAWYRGTPYYFEADLHHDKTTEEISPLWPGDSEGADDATAKTKMLDEAQRKAEESYSRERQQFEHIAGPGCEHARGYSGHEIGVEEMRGCQIAQCLIRKPPGYEFVPSFYDEDFEVDGNFFLSGLTDHMPSRDYSNPTVTPARQQCEQPYAENIMWDEDNANEYALPFHPSCLEVFKQLSRMSKGSVDINSLTSWWSLEADYEIFHGFPRHPDLSQCNGQEWEHSNGTAYLAANPLYVPKLKEICAAAIESDPAFNPRTGAFTLPQPPSTSPSYDPFLSIPNEILTEILDHLTSQDIATLRLSSRAFTELPIAYFQKLILREMPWLWEAWPTFKTSTRTKYSLWATLTAGTAMRTLTKADREIEAIQDYVAIVKKEMPELSEQMDEALKTQTQAVRAAHEFDIENREERFPCYLPPDRTNYYKLYTLIIRHWKDLKGLRNRQRIWRDCEEIMRRADAYKESGRIDESGITEELEDVIRGNREAFQLREARRRKEREKYWKTYERERKRLVEEKEREEKGESVSQELPQRPGLTFVNTFSEEGVMETEGARVT